jgi:hypothetical protein
MLGGRVKFFPFDYKESDMLVWVGRTVVCFHGNGSYLFFNRRGSGFIAVWMQEGLGLEQFLYCLLHFFLEFEIMVQNRGF